MFVLSVLTLFMSPSIVVIVVRKIAIAALKTKIGCSIFYLYVVESKFQVLKGCQHLTCLSVEKTLMPIQFLVGRAHY